MDIEFHYYLNLIIALATGHSEQVSYKIAYSSQYVDDNSSVLQIYNNNNKLIYENDFSQTYNIMLSKFELIKTYACFHFLPGNINALDKKLRENEIAATITTANSAIAKEVLDWAFNSNNIYLIGIASHAYSDTWSHQNFTSLNHPINSLPGFINNLIPNYGHADFSNVPDQINVTWQDPRLTIKNVVNNERFLDAFEKLFNHYLQKTKSKNSKIKVGQLLNKVKQIMECELNEKRLEKYQKLCAQLFNIQIKHYHSYQWEHEALFYNDEQKIWVTRRNFEDSDWYQFQEAVKIYKKFTWDKINHLYMNYLGINNG